MMALLCVAVAWIAVVVLVDRHQVLKAIKREPPEWTPSQLLSKADMLHALMGDKSVVVRAPPGYRMDVSGPDAKAMAERLVPRRKRECCDTYSGEGHYFDCTVCPPSGGAP